MSLLSESLTIGLLLTLVFGALFFYLYSRVTYAEKRVSLMENILIDIKMKEEQHQMHVLPQVPPQMSFQDAMNSIHMPHFNPMHNTESNIHIINEQPMNEEIQAEELQAEELQAEELYSEVLDTPVIHETKTELSVNYEAMTKDELIDIAKKKGLRVGNRPGREKLLQIIHQSESLAGTVEETKENKETKDEKDEKD